MRKADLIIVGIAEALVLGDEVVKERGAIAPMAEDEYRRLDGDVFEQRFETALASGPEAVFDALSGDREGSQPERGVDAKSSAQRRPLLKGDAGQHAGADETQESMTPVVGEFGFRRHGEGLVIQKRKIEGAIYSSDQERCAPPAGFGFIGQVRKAGRVSHAEGLEAESQVMRRMPEVKGCCEAAPTD